MAAGLAVLDTMLQKGVLENCRRQGAYFLEGLKKLMGKYSFVK